MASKLAWLDAGAVASLAVFIERNREGTTRFGMQQAQSMITKRVFVLRRAFRIGRHELLSNRLTIRQMLVRIARGPVVGADPLFVSLL